MDKERGLETNFEALRGCSKTQFADAIVELVVSTCEGSGFTVSEKNRQKYRDAIFMWLEEPSKLFVRKEKLC